MRSASPNERKPPVLLLATGGTISMLKDPQTGRSVTARSAADLLALTSLAPAVEVRPLDFPLQYRQPADLLALARCIQQETRSDLGGVVVTHGTDTMEEVAFLVDEVIPPSVPIVFTGAMRPGWAVGFDGARNLENALRIVKAAPAGYGALVTMSDEIFEAWSVYKADTGALDAFTPRRGAALGRIMGEQVEFMWRPIPRARLGRIPKSLPTSVPMLTLGVADDAALLSRPSSLPVQGIVVASMAAGYIPPEAHRRVLALAESGLPVVLCSGATSGRTAEDCYYPQAYDELLAAGVLIEDRLSARKARIRLMLSLGLGVPYKPFGEEFVVRRSAISSQPKGGSFSAES